MTAPQWSTHDEGDLLELVADGPMSGHADHEWDAFLEVLRTVAVAEAGRLDPNAIRPRLHGLIAPQRIGAYTNRAVSRGLIETTDEWVVSDDSHGRNRGKPARVRHALPALFSEEPA